MNEWIPPHKKKELKKDPGIPNLWPFKKELLQKIQAKREMEKQEAADVEMQTHTSKQSQMAKMQFNAVSRYKEFEAKRELLREGKLDQENGERELHQASLSQASKRAYYREFKKVVEASDVIIEVLDARDPLGCRCPDIEKNIMSTHPDKRIVLVLNKIDLVPREVVQSWLTYLRGELPTVAFKSNTQNRNQKSRLSRADQTNAAKANNLMRKSSACLGASSLIQLLKNYSRSADIKRTITVGIIGYPNVGKSSVINSLKRSKVVNVGSTPGMTKNAQEIQLDQHIKLLDCPGIIFSSTNTLDSDIILRNAVRIEHLDDPIAPISQVLARCKPERLMERYQVPSFETVDHFLTSIAKNRGYLNKGGKPRLQHAARIVLQDWVSGKIPFFTLPPERSSDFVAEFNAANGNVEAWARDIDDSDLMDIATVQDRINEKLVPIMSSQPPTYLHIDVDVESDSDVDIDDADQYFHDSDEDDEDDDDVLEDDSEDDE